MVIGDFQDRVTFQTMTSTSDGMGGYTNDGWGSDNTVWAKVRALDVTRQVIEGREFQGNLYEITVYYNAVPSINTQTMRVQYDSNNLNIHTVENVNEKDEFYKLVCGG